MYDPTRTSLILAGQVIDGFAEDKMIETNFNEPDRIIQKMGARGRVHESANPNSTGYLKIFLMQDSESNALLSTLFQTRAEFGWLFTDSSSVATIASSTSSRIKTVPAIVRAKSMQEVEWLIFANTYTYFMGGS